MTAGARDGTAAQRAWMPTVAYIRAAAAAFALVGIGVLWQRPDALVLAAPLAAATYWAALRRPDAAPGLAHDLGHPTVREGDATSWTVTLDGLERGQLVSAALADAPWIQRHPIAGAVTSLAGGPRAELSVNVRSLRWGIQEVPGATVVAASAWDAFAWSATTAPRALTTIPRPSPYDPDAPSHTTVGLVGQYRSVRRGEGSEFAAIRPFQFGDRVHRINWARTVRSTRMLVNATFADHDTHVHLLLDAAEDFGASGGVDGTASSLDMTVRAAAAIAEDSAHRGDRVSLRTFGTRAPVAVPPATGRKHLRRVLRSLTLLRAGHSSGHAEATAPVAHDSHLTVMLSPLISPAALDRAVALGRSGAIVVVVDTLPDDLSLDLDRVAALAWRLRLLRRRHEMRRVEQLGIPVVHWTGAGSLDRFLRDAARRTRAPRMARR